MIQDKDFTIRLIKQLSNLLAKLLLGKNEGEEKMSQQMFNTAVKDIFKMNFYELATKPTNEISLWVEEHESKYHADYYELLAHLFYFKNKENPNSTFAEKAKIFYQQWLDKSKIFSFEIIARIKELENNHQ